MIGKIIFFLSISIIISGSAPASEWKKLMIHDRLLIRVEVVKTAREQTLGMGGREVFSDGTGMLFVYQAPGEHLFWMKRMRIAIDMLWIRQGQIVFIEHQVPPPSAMVRDRHLKRYGHGVVADVVLELPAGYSRQHSIHIGQSIRLIP